MHLVIMTKKLIMMLIAALGVAVAAAPVVGCDRWSTWGGSGHTNRT
jgi:hypothetical protein